MAQRTHSPGEQPAVGERILLVADVRLKAIVARSRCQGPRRLTPASAYTVAELLAGALAGLRGDHISLVGKHAGAPQGAIQGALSEYEVIQEPQRRLALNLHRLVDDECVLDLLVAREALDGLAALIETDDVEGQQLERQRRHVPGAA